MKLNCETNLLDSCRKKTIDRVIRLQFPKDTYLNNTALSARPSLKRFISSAKKWRSSLNTKINC